jgi:hypothetical protein
VSVECLPLDLDAMAVDAIRKIGGWFREKGGISDCLQPRVLSPYHGRSAIYRLEDGSFVSIKGLGWTWANPCILRSTKDAKLTFGLYSEKDAVREIQISRRLNEIDGAFAQVLGAARLTVVCVDGMVLDLRELRWSNDELINPCLLYTLQKSPLRVMDLLFLSDAELSEAINKACLIKGWEREEYSFQFAKELGKSVASLHRAGGVNDTLEPGNVTLCAEVTDFECVDLPTVASPFEADNELSKDSRRAKEIVYGAEVVTFLAVRLGGSGRSEQQEFLASYTESGGTARDTAATLGHPLFL